MKIAVIGVGYVGLSGAVGFAMKGHNVIAVGRTEEKLKGINRGVSPIYEPLLDEKLKEVTENGMLFATTDLKKAITESEVVFICVGTPSMDNGSIDLSQMKKASEDIGRLLKESGSYKVIVVKSTVISGTTEDVVIKTLEENSGKKAGRDFGVAMNPEFLREGFALDDFLKPDRIVIGEIDKRSGDLVEKTYRDFNSPVLRTDLKTAEMIKYVSNAFLATKISFANEIGNICKEIGVDIYEVMKGVGMDHRISPKFLRAGMGWGGSCFPKDVAALIYKAGEIGYKPELLESVTELNRRQKVRMVEQLESRIGDLRGKTIAVLGLSFKPDTDDIRDAPAIDIIKKLKDGGAAINAYDPKAAENMKRIFPETEVNYFSNPRDALAGADACLIVTEWAEFAELEDADFNNMRNRVIIEGRRVLNRERVKDYEGICW